MISTKEINTQYRIFVRYKGESKDIAPAEQVRATHIKRSL